MFTRFALRFSSALLLLLPAQQGLAEEFEVHGSPTAMQALLSPHQDSIEQSSGHTLKLVSRGSDSGVMDLVVGAADIAVISGPLDEVVEKLNKKKSGSVDINKLRSHPIGSTRVVFAVHDANPVRELRLDQVLDILAGRVDNWAQVGGADAPIQIVAELQGGVRSIVEKMLADRGDTLAPATTVATAVMAAYAIEHLPHAVAITTAAAVDNNKKRLIVTDTPIEQSMYLVTYGQPSELAEKLIEAVQAQATVREQPVEVPDSEPGAITLLSSP